MGAHRLPWRQERIFDVARGFLPRVAVRHATRKLRNRRQEPAAVLALRALSRRGDITREDLLTVEILKAAPVADAPARPPAFASGDRPRSSGLRLLLSGPRGSGAISPVITADRRFTAIVRIAGRSRRECDSGYEGVPVKGARPVEAWLRDARLSTGYGAPLTELKARKTKPGKRSEAQSATRVQFSPPEKQRAAARLAK